MRKLDVSKGAKIRIRYSQIPHLTQDMNGKVTTVDAYLSLASSIYILSFLSALSNPDVCLSWAKFSSSLVDIKICCNQ